MAAMIISVLPYSNVVGIRLCYSLLLRGVGDNMNLRITLAVVVVSLLAGWGYGKWQYSSGWKEGRAALVAEQQEKAQAKLAKQITRQQSDNIKAAAAESKGAVSTVTITKEVIKYIKVPGRTKCTFDSKRVELKRQAIENANHIEGYDE